MPDHKKHDQDDEDWGSLADLLHTLQKELEAGNTKMQAKASGPHLRISHCHITLPLLLRRNDKTGEIDAALPKTPSESLLNKLAEHSRRPEGAPKTAPPKGRASTGKSTKRQTAKAKAAAELARKEAVAVSADQEIADDLLQVEQAFELEKMLNDRLTVLELNFKGHMADHKDS
ncbi:hypothetical protein GCM10017044_15640 [Kordiimonas sediminis]|uniref:Uncharacterized protein n=1 Tax=Kordiimonas sediminis TaxID=1735581 RepID=A0A919ARE6_9PROT|nr:hypothetical protein [Kordiimonas sediminis]GHF22358.1 hypothetical protein GCM10017044_15640 [Kordiimonas sediminis]